MSSPAASVSAHSWTRLVESCADVRANRSRFDLISGSIRCAISLRFSFFFFPPSLLLNAAAAGIHACQNMSLNLFAPLCVSSLLTGCWTLSHGSPQERDEEQDPAARSVSYHRTHRIWHYAAI